MNDPNEILARLRELGYSIQAGIVNGDAPDKVIRDAADMVEIFTELDRFLSAGNEFRPDAWQKQG